MSRGLKRMRAAVSEMAENLQTQQEAVSNFQSSIRGLRHEVKMLGINMREFNTNLKTINVEPLGRKARRLARIMDSFERGSDG